MAREIETGEWDWVRHCWKTNLVGGNVPQEETNKSPYVGDVRDYTREPEHGGTSSLYSGEEFPCHLPRKFFADIPDFLSNEASVPWESDDEEYIDRYGGRRSKFHELFGSFIKTRY